MPRGGAPPVISCRDAVYMLGAPLGEGSYSVVREAVHCITLQRVAIKIVKMKKLRKVKGALDCIEQEVRILESLRKHNLNNVQRLLDFIREDDRMCIVLELGMGSVQDILDAQYSRKIPVATARHIFRDLMLGLQHIHSLGIVHKDIKPSNLMVMADGQVQLSDFGVSEVLSTFDPDDICHSSLGSPAYQPPEIARGQDEFSGFKYDVWSCGVSLYHILTGNLPFAGKGMYELFESICKHEAELVDIPADVHALMKGMLEKDPEKRWSVEQVLNYWWVQATPRVPTSQLCVWCFGNKEVVSQLHSMGVEIDPYTDMVRCKPDHNSSDEEIEYSSPDRPAPSVFSELTASPLTKDTPFSRPTFPSHSNPLENPISLQLPAKIVPPALLSPSRGGGSERNGGGDARGGGASSPQSDSPADANTVATALRTIQLVNETTTPNNVSNNGASNSRVVRLPDDILEGSPMGSSHTASEAEHKRRMSSAIEGCSVLPSATAPVTIRGAAGAAGAFGGFGGLGRHQISHQHQRHANQPQSKSSGMPRISLTVGLLNVLVAPDDNNALYAAEESEDDNSDSSISSAGSEMAQLHPGPILPRAVATFANIRDLAMAHDHGLTRAPSARLIGDDMHRAVSARAIMGRGGVPSAFSTSAVGGKRPMGVMGGSSAEVGFGRGMLGVFRTHSSRSFGGSPPLPGGGTNNGTANGWGGVSGIYSSMTGAFPQVDSVSGLPLTGKRDSLVPHEEPEERSITVTLAEVLSAAGAAEEEIPDLALSLRAVVGGGCMHGTHDDHCVFHTGRDVQGSALICPEGLIQRDKALQHFAQRYVTHYEESMDDGGGLIPASSLRPFPTLPRKRKWRKLIGCCSKNTDGEEPTRMMSRYQDGEGSIYQAGSIPGGSMPEVAFNGGHQRGKKDKCVIM